VNTASLENAERVASIGHSLMQVQVMYGEG
jgi:hypothetical protein